MNAGTRLAAAVIAAVFAVGAAACGDDEPVGTEPGLEEELRDRRFLSTSVTVDGEDHDLVEGTRISISFDGEIGASAGCNSMGGTYRFDGDVLVVDELGMTEIGCDPARHAQDDWLAGILTSRPTVALDGDELTITSGATVMGLLDREVADPDRPLPGTTWIGDSIIKGDTASSMPAAAEVRFVFEEGHVTVAAGCNTGGAAVEIGDETLRFGTLGLTRMHCGGARDEVESHVVALVGSGEVRYGIEAGTLSLHAGDLGLVLIAEE